jgi:HKD family nuclease
MQLFLHTPEQTSKLGPLYKRAFAEAEEIFLVSAYLTEWDLDLKLNPRCVHFRIIIGRDFGITRKAACLKLLDWLANEWKANFLVAEYISGFHPKAMFWKNASGQTYALIGSSNLTRAAFDSNYEANFYGAIDKKLYQKATEWCDAIEKNTEIVDEGWIDEYNEAPPRNGSADTKAKGDPDVGVRSLPLPIIVDGTNKLRQRRNQMRIAKTKVAGLQRHFRRCAAGQITSNIFYEQLATHWGYEVGNRLQGKGFEIKGKHSDFKRLSESLVKIFEASPSRRDNVVRAQIDSLSDDEVPTRGAFLSEMLCQFFPDDYPLLNKPVFTYLHQKKFKPPRGASEGARYIYLARTLRRSLTQNPSYAAKNLAELDAVIWHSVNPG